MSGIAGVWLVALLAAPTVFFAEQQSAGAGSDRGVPVLRASRVESRPVIDGHITEAEWAGAAVATGFTQRAPHPGRPATQRTEVRILYDDEALYVAARMYDSSPDSIVGLLARRDDEVHSDWFFIGIDSHLDRRTAFAFGLNPAGVKMDVLFFDDTQSDPSWDAVWEGAARVDDSGWAAEFRIPLSQLRFSRPQPGQEQVWGVNFRRRIARNGEDAFWAPLPPDDARLVSLFGELHGLADLRPPRRLEFMPYAVARGTRAPGDRADPFHRAVQPFGTLGADLKAGLSSDITLTATFNPDFGQVEADPSVVNLTPSETFFSERRPFFVEGVDIFRFGIGLGDGDLGNESLFYSRRIGRPPQGSVAGQYTTGPDQATILAAAKLSGKTAGGWTVGVLDALTSSEYGRYHTDGAEGKVPVEPLTNYAVGRVIKDFRGGETAVGGIVTATNRAIPESGELDWLRRSAYSGGIDFRHRFGAGEAVQLSGRLVASHVAGTAESIDRVQRSPIRYFQRPDAEHLDYDPERTSLQGLAGKLEVFKMQGNWVYAALGMTASPGFEVNDLGYQSNADVAIGVMYVGYRSFEPGSFFRNWQLGGNGWTGLNYAGDRLANGGNVNFTFQLQNLWNGGIGVNLSTSEYSTSMLRGGPLFRNPARWNLWSNLVTDRRKTTSLSTSVNASGQPESGAWSLGISPSIRIRPANNIDLSLGPSLQRNLNPLQYTTARTADGQRYYVLGTVDQTTVSLTTRLNYTFSPDLSLQFYAQPFIGAGEYSEFKLVADPKGRELADRVHVLTGEQIHTATVDDRLRHHVDVTGSGVHDFHFNDPSFTLRQFRSNLVLRWEYRLGSTLFLVWSQGRTDLDRAGRFDLGDDVNALRGTAATNVLMLKVSYWLGL